VAEDEQPYLVQRWTDINCNRVLWPFCEHFSFNRVRVSNVQRLPMEHTTHVNNIVTLSRLEFLSNSKCVTVFGIIFMIYCVYIFVIFFYVLRDTDFI